MLQGIPEQRAASVDVGHIHQHLRLELQRVKRGAISAQRDFVARSTVEILPGWNGELQLRCGLVVVETWKGRRCGAGRCGCARAAFLLLSLGVGSSGGRDAPRSRARYTRLEKITSLHFATHTTTCPSHPTIFWERKAQLRVCPAYLSVVRVHRRHHVRSPLSRWRSENR